MGLYDSGRGILLFISMYNRKYFKSINCLAYYLQGSQSITFLGPPYKKSKYTKGEEFASDTLSSSYHNQWDTSPEQS